MKQNGKRKEKGKIGKIEVRKMASDKKKKDKKKKKNPE